MELVKNTESKLRESGSKVLELVKEAEIVKSTSSRLYEHFAQNIGMNDNIKIMFDKFKTSIPDISQISCEPPVFSTQPDSKQGKYFNHIQNVTFYIYLYIYIYIIIIAGFKISIQC